VSSLDVGRFLKSRVGLIVLSQGAMECGGLVSEEVIEQSLLQDAKPTEKEEMHKEAIRCNIMEQLHLEASLGALRKLLLHKGNAVNKETVEEEHESIKEAAEMAQVLTHLGRTMDDLGAVEPISGVVSQSDVDTNQEQEVTLDNKILQTENPTS